LETIVLETRRLRQRRNRGPVRAEQRGGRRRTSSAEFSRNFDLFLLGFFLGYLPKIGNVLT
jgi:hypothetical protein